MTISPPDVLLGAQVPSIMHRPPDVHSLDDAEEAIELAEQVRGPLGRPMFGAQREMLRLALGSRPDGKWSAFEVADVQPRQNGKGDSIEARELAGLFLFGEQLLIHTAHEFPTANEAFLRMVAVIESDRWLSSKVQRIRFANGEQGVELKSGGRLKYRARTGGAGRGFAGADLVVYDEAYALKAEHVAASLPTLSTSPNAQVWFASSAGLGYSSALWRLRVRALAGEAGRLAYSEFTAEDVALDAQGRPRSTPIDVEDRRLWALANPAAGSLISWEYLEAEFAAMGEEKFARERLGVWDPLEGSEGREPKIPADGWAGTATVDLPAMEPGSVVVAFGVTRDGSHSSVAVGAGSITSPYVELIEHREGVGWLPAFLVELCRRWSPLAVGCNNAGPAGAQVAPVLTAMRDAGLDPDLMHPLGPAAYRDACGGFFTDVIEGRLRRPADGQGPLDLAAGDATERPLGDAWVWDRRASTVPISPLEAVTIARALLPVEAPAAPAPVYAY